MWLHCACRRAYLAKVVCVDNDKDGAAGASTHSGVLALDGNGLFVSVAVSANVPEEPGGSVLAQACHLPQSPHTPRQGRVGVLQVVHDQLVVQGASV